MMPILVEWMFTDDRMMITHITLELGTAGIARVLTIANILKVEKKCAPSLHLENEMLNRGRAVIKVGRTHTPTLLLVYFFSIKIR